MNWLGSSNTSRSRMRSLEVGRRAVLQSPSRSAVGLSASPRSWGRPSMACPLSSLPKQSFAGSRKTGVGKSQLVVKRGRRRTSQETCSLVAKLARENECGFMRILGEFRKLGIQSISRNTVKCIPAKHGIDPDPCRAEGTWDEFLNLHAASPWQCDFFSQNALTFQGIKDTLVLALLNTETRQAILSPATLHPKSLARGSDQVLHRGGQGTEASDRSVQHDRDTKFTKRFLEALK